MSDPVSWFVIEPGWEVVGSDGKLIGTVNETIGDSDDDIFNGLAIVSGVFARARYVPAEQVAEITEGRVTLSIAGDAAGSLGEFEEPPTSAEILPEDAGPVARAEGATIDRVRDHATKAPFFRRVWVSIVGVLGRRR